MYKPVIIQVFSLHQRIIWYKNIEHIYFRQKYCLWSRGQTGSDGGSKMAAFQEPAQDEDSAELTFPKEFENAETLLISEVKI